jgi:hypothetical protein
MAMKCVDLLKKMSFGVEVAEEEVNELASYFVETNQWSQMANGEIDIVRGEKGSGKSAFGDQAKESGKAADDFNAKAGAAHRLIGVRRRGTRSSPSAVVALAAPATASRSNDR